MRLRAIHVKGFRRPGQLGKETPEALVDKLSHALARENPVEEGAVRLLCGKVGAGEHSFAVPSHGVRPAPAGGPVRTPQWIRLPWLHCVVGRLGGGQVPPRPGQSSALLMQVINEESDHHVG